HFSVHGIDEFVICCGYKGYMIKEYFANYFLHMSDVTIDLASNGIEVHSQRAENWKITLVDTGEGTQTGGRIKRIAEHLDGTFCLTYGDGVSDVDLTALIAHHRAQSREATVTAIQPAGRFGGLAIEDGLVTQFQEKPEGDGRWINGGFFVCEPEVLDRIAGDQTSFEQGPLETLAQDRQLSVWKHGGFWQAMDTLRDRTTLETLWAKGEAPWKTWT
ncbi:glucose-1-phosphate cytidylyltransferase, partial [Litoreibacter sp.]|nr:glucose-1-phosphate cytidylyltransferase [Litoreibacter sp.]